MRNSYLSSILKEKKMTVYLLEFMEYTLFSFGLAIWQFYSVEMSNFICPRHFFPNNSKAATGAKRKLVELEKLL